MKKAAWALSLFILTAAELLAQGADLHLNYYYTNKETITVQDDNGGEGDLTRSAIPVGVDMNIDLPINADAVQFGLNIDVGIDFMGDCDYVWWGEQEDFFVGAYFISVGGLLKLNLAEHLSVAFRPGIQLSQQLGTGSLYLSGVDTGYDIETVATYLAFSLNAGATLWLSRDVGINVGIDYDKPFWGWCEFTNRKDSTDSFSWDIVGGSSMRYFVGLSIGLGQPAQTSTRAHAATARSSASAASSEPATASARKRTAGQAQTQAGDAPAPNGTADKASANEAGATAADSAGRVATGSINLKRLRPEVLKRTYNLKLNGVVSGPYSIATISLMAKTGLITWNTPVKSSVLDSWSKIGNVTEFEPLFK